MTRFHQALARFAATGLAIVALVAATAAQSTDEPTDAPPPTRILSGHLAPFTAAFDATGTRIVTASEDQSVRVWPADGQGKVLGIRYKKERPQRAFFIPRSDWVAVRVGKRIDLWDVGAKGNPIVRSIGGDGWANGAFATPDGTHLILNVGGALTRHPLKGTGQPTTLTSEASWTMDQAPDGTLAVLTHDEELLVWKPDGTPIALGSRAPEIDHDKDSWATAVVFSRDSKWVAVNTHERLHVVSLDGTAPTRVVDKKRSSPWRSRPAFNADATRIAVPESNGYVEVIDLRDAGKKPVTWRWRRARIETVAFAADGSALYIHGRSEGRSASGVLRYPLDGGAPMALTGFPVPPDDVTVSPDGRHILSTGVDLGIRITPVSAFVPSDAPPRRTNLNVQKNGDIVRIVMNGRSIGDDVGEALQKVDEILRNDPKPPRAAYVRTSDDTPGPVLATIFDALFRAGTETVSLREWTKPRRDRARRGRRSVRIGRGPIRVEELVDRAKGEADAKKKKKKEPPPPPVRLVAGSHDMNPAMMRVALRRDGLRVSVLLDGELVGPMPAAAGAAFERFMALREKTGVDNDDWCLRIDLAPDVSRRQIAKVVEPCLFALPRAIAAFGGKRD